MMDIFTSSLRLTNTSCMQIFIRSRYRGLFHIDWWLHNEEKLSEIVEEFILHNFLRH